jgi:hypothetical protein
MRIPALLSEAGILSDYLVLERLTENARKQGFQNRWGKKRKRTSPHWYPLMVPKDRLLESSIDWAPRNDVIFS